jgi:hypothetical protein
VNGTVAWTDAGLTLYTGLYGVNVLLYSAIVATPLEHEALAAQLRWRDFAAGKFPSLASVGMWATFTSYGPLWGWALYLKYGWPSALLPAAVWVRYVIFGRLQFAEAPIEGKHALLRQLTLPEHLTIERLAWGLGPYIAFDLYCIHDGQWDGKTVGRTGGVLLVLSELACVVAWWFTWGQRVFTTCDRKDRAQVFVKAYLSGIAQPPMHQLLHAIALWPDQLNNAELSTMRSGVSLWHMDVTAL